MHFHPREHIFLLLALTARLQAQNANPGQSEPAHYADTLRRVNEANILFERNLNTFNWLGRARVDTAFAGTRLFFDESYTANIVQIEATSSGPRSRQQSNQQNATLNLLQPMGGPVGGLFRWSSLVFSDDRGVGLSNASNQTLLAGVQYQAAPGVTLSPTAGYRWDSQQGFHNRGLTVDIGANVQDLNLDGYVMQGEAQFRRDRLNPRELDEHYLRGVVQRDFSPWTRDSMAFSVGRARSDFYAPADTGIQSRVENDLSVSNLLEYNVTPNVGISLYAGVIDRGFDKLLLSYGPPLPRTAQPDTHIDEAHLDAYMETSYRSDDRQTAAWLRLAHSERNETHTALESGGTVSASERQDLELSNNLSRLTSLSGSMGFPVSSSDRVFLSGFISILRYDTPSLQNVEDRDEQLLAFVVSTSHRLSRFLSLELLLNGTVGHIVYLLSERSANNNVNRVLRLAPRAVYTVGDWLSSTNSFEVLANYTVYDFEQQLSQAQSFSYRQVGWLDSSRVELTDRIGLDLFGYIKLNERGQLHWSDFTERTEASYAERTLAGQARFSPGPLTVLAAGLRYFSQSQFGYDETGKHLVTYLSSIGPTCSIQWRVGPHSNVGLRGWYERRKGTDGGVSTLITMTMNIDLTF